MRYSSTTILAMASLLLLAACTSMPEAETPQQEREQQPQPKQNTDPPPRDPRMPEVVYASASDAVPQRVQQSKLTW